MKINEKENVLYLFVINCSLDSYYNFTSLGGEVKLSDDICLVVPRGAFHEETCVYCECTVMFVRRDRSSLIKVIGVTTTPINAQTSKYIRIIC